MRAALLCLLVTALIAPAAAQAAYAPLERPGPALEVQAAAVDAATKCSPGIANATRAPVLLSPGTGATADENFSWNYERSLTARGIPWCGITMPGHAQSDIQVSAEYLVHAIRRIHRLSGRRVAVMGHSQGGMSMRWALRFWPDTRTMVDDVIGFAGSNHGTDSGGGCANGCTPAGWQQGARANFIAALNSRAETHAGISYTEVYTHRDEVVTPNADDSGSSSVRGGGGRITNVATQDICPANTSEHFIVGTTDPVAYALAMDALDHDGPASEGRIDRAACTQVFAPGVDPTYLDTYRQIVSVVPGVAADVSPVNTIGVPVVRQEPALRCYAFSECTPASGGSDAAGRCVSAVASARGTVFGPAALGRTRSAQRRRLPGRRGKNRKGIDRFCVAGGGALEIGYPTGRISRKGRRAARGRAILVLASSPRLRVRGLARGARTSTLRKRLRGERSYLRGPQPLVHGPRRQGHTRVPHPRRAGARRGAGQPPADRRPAATRRLLRAWQL